MRTGIPLSVIRNEVLIEAGFSTKAGSSVFSKERIDQMISRHERMMSIEHTWPSVHFEETVTVDADESETNLPVYINMTDITGVYVLFNAIWHAVRQGIHQHHRSSYAATDREVPIKRWQAVEPGNVKFETWPVGSVAQTIKFVGSKSIVPMTDDEQSCTLDADVLVLRVAAEILGRDKKEDAQVKLDAASRLANTILKRQQITRDDINMGGTVSPTRPLRPGIDYIPPGSD